MQLQSPAIIPNQRPSPRNLPSAEPPASQLPMSAMGWMWTSFAGARVWAKVPFAA